jgi:putative peptide zinc metalloprotease protein
VSARGEIAWFLFYAPASFIYRLSVLFSVSLFIGTHFFFVGVALAIWTLLASIGWPICKALRFVLVSPAAAARRSRAVTVTAAGVAIVLAAVFAVPVPHGTVARGVVWIPDQARVTAETNGLIVRVLQPSGSHVARGVALVELIDDYLDAQRRRDEAKLKELRSRLLAAEAATPYDTQVLRKQIELAQAELAEADRKFQALTVRAPNDGVFIVHRPDDLVGAYIKKGELLGYVMPAGAFVVRAAVPETEIEAVQHLTKLVAARSDVSPDKVMDGFPIARIVPQATRQLPSSALAQTNGGPFALDPTAKKPDTSLLPFFEVDVALPATALAPRWGERVWLRFDHGGSPLAQRIYRNLRQVFLKRFNV